MRSVLYVICAIGVLACAGTVPSGAHGAFPGGNGKIAFTSGRDGNFEIYTMNADGSAQTNITNNAATDRDPAWSADGLQVAFTIAGGGAAKLRAMDGSDGLSGLPGFQPRPDGVDVAGTHSSDLVLVSATTPLG